MLPVVRRLPSLLEALDPRGVARVAAGIEVTELSVGTERFRCHRMSNLRIVSDSCEFHEADAVFPLHPESLLLGLTIPSAPAGGKFLDVGCGSGILPVLAADKGWEAAAIDVNPRALAFAAVSAALSARTIRLDEADILSWEPGKKFDFITLNLPFEPNAGAGRNFVHSDGGRLGHELSLAAASRLPALLGEGGTAVMICFSLQQSGESTVERDLRASSLPLDCTLIRLSPEISVRSLLPRYGSRVGRQVETALADEGFHSFFVELTVFTNGHARRPLEVLHVPVANADWIYPLGEHALTTAPQ